MSYELNIDGLVGPTHNYSGLSYGNIASIRHQREVSHPKRAFLQGLKKMKLVADLGVKQALLPPHERPYIPALRRLGFTGSDAHIVQQAAKEAPALFLQCCSASGMWMANAATVSPSADSADGRVHITPANLVHGFHRSIESTMHARLLKLAFPDDRLFVHHAALPATALFADEGAANHTRFYSAAEINGVHLFVYGRRGSGASLPKVYPARHTLEASEAVCRLHQLSPESLLFVQQNPAAIDAGAFHNDVVAVGNGTLFLYHEQAFVDTELFMQELRAKVLRSSGEELRLLPVSAVELPLEDAVASYLFNSQLVTASDGQVHLVASQECLEIDKAHRVIDRLLKESSRPIAKVHYVDLQESMRNGGGAACLRLRVLLTEQELAAMHSPVLLTESLYVKLSTWAETHYREQISLDALQDPQLLEESHRALDSLTQILQLGSIYSFQN